MIMRSKLFILTISVIRVPLHHLSIVIVYIEYMQCRIVRYNLAVYIEHVSRALLTSIRGMDSCFFTFFSLVIYYRTNEKVFDADGLIINISFIFNLIQMSYAFISRYYRGNYYYDLLTEFISYLIYFLIILIIIISFKIHKYINLF